MHFGLSEEQQELATTVRALLSKRADSQAVRAAAASDAGYDAALWQLLCEQIGAAALAIPERFDGAGFTLFETGIVLDELGRSLAPSPLLASTVAAEALLASGDENAAAELLPRIAAGEIATLAWPGTTSRSATPGVTADGAVLSGTVENVLYGDHATVLLVAADAEDGLALFHVDPSLVDATWTPAMDTTQRLATLTFDNTTATRIAGDASSALERARLAGCVGVANLQLGCAQRALDMTVGYAKERVQFGRPIGSFQALKHRMADMLVELEMTRSAAWAATYAVATHAADAETLVAAAASYCSEALTHIASETVQLHGGIAITWEHDAQLVFKRAHALNQLFGLPHEHRAVLIP